jgi:RHS repeat-associated protein
MMTSLTGADRNERYLYTADDERVAVVRNIGSGRRTTWSISALDNHLLRTWTDDTTTGTRQFTWSEDEIWRGSTLLASDSPTGLKRYHLDHLGSSRLVTNGAGVRIGEQTFDPFGTGGTIDGGRLQFTGHERDIPPSGSGLVLDYMHARYYDGAGGRFLSVDPVLETQKALREPQRWNRYAYALNNPIRYTDPTGKVVAGAEGVAEEIKERKLQTKQAQLEAYSKQLAAQVKSGGVDSKTAMNLYWNKALTLNQPVTAKGAKPTAEQLKTAKENALLIATGAALNFGVVRGSRAAVGDAITGGSMGADTLHHFFINAINTYDGVPVRLQRFGANELRGEKDVRDIAANNYGATFGDLLQRNPSAQSSDIIP